MGVDPLGPLSRVVVFQYNPDEVTRNIRPREGGGPRQASDAHRAWGAPSEDVSMTVELDATDQLEAGDPVAAASGILPALSALEMMLHPGSAQVIANTALLAAGTIEILPIALPVTVLVWGPARVVPVRITSLAITEQAYAPGLVPLRASVDLSADVLTYDELSVTDLAFGLHLAHVVSKEVLAVVGGVGGAASAVADLVGGG